jgi:hypothetical protein
MQFISLFMTIFSSCRIYGYARGFCHSPFGLHTGHPHFIGTLIDLEWGAMSDIGWITRFK